MSLDAIGFFHDDIVDVRKLIPESANIDYAIIASTHTHESNDLMGIWGETWHKNGINPEHMKYVKTQIVKSIVQASENTRPAKLAFAEDMYGADGLVSDSRKPVVKDPGLRFIQAVDIETDSTLGVLVSWANHPETLWSRNLEISSDFPHYLRESLEKGIFNADTMVVAGLGGTAVYFNGAIGGLMTTRPSNAIKDPFADTSYSKPSFKKIKAQGEQLALLAFAALATPDTVVDNFSIGLQAKTVYFPLDNLVFRLGKITGLLKRSVKGWFNMRSEVAAFELGPATFVCIPGEIYPEIINGGIESPPGQDFVLDPIETPAIRNMMHGKYRFVLGLANDEIGYIIPKSEWDEEPPYLYEPENSTYGEVNSLGPDTAPILYKEIKDILTKLQGGTN